MNSKLKSRETRKSKRNLFDIIGANSLLKEFIFKYYTKESLKEDQV